MTEPKKPPPPVLKNSAAAPFVYFDEAPTCGQIGGMIAVELCASTVSPTQGGNTAMERVVTAHLRGSPAAMRSLVNAIQSALVLLERQPEQGAIKLAS